MVVVIMMVMAVAAAVVIKNCAHVLTSVYSI
jgi:hypothetical protein